MDKTPQQRVAEEKLREAIEAVQAIMPKGQGIAILTWEHGTDQGHIGYIANAARDDMRRAMTELLGKWASAAVGKKFFPLTLDAFEAYTREKLEAETCAQAREYRDATLAAVTAYRDLSNNVERPKGFLMKVIGVGKTIFNQPCYLASFDVDAHHGRGDAKFTDNPDKAMRFETPGELFAAWKTQSKVKPLREDGEPNRPLTAFHIEVGPHG